MSTRVSRMIAGLAIGLSLVMVVPMTAGADSGSRTPTRVYHQEVLAIDRAFHQAVVAARTELSNELRRATNAGQRSTARARYALAVALATTQRDQALVALGAPPHAGVILPTGFSTTTTIH